jgi:AcrR family transcriptional regulator
LFVDRGYFGVSIRDIAATAGITNGAVYGHFKTKGHLLVEVIRWKIAERDAATDYETEQQSASSIDLLYDSAGRDTRLLEVDAAAAARLDPDVAGGLAALYRERRIRIEEVLIGTATDTEALAWFITTVGAGIGVREAAGMRSLDADKVRATIWSAFDGVRRDLS